MFKIYKNYEPAEEDLGLNGNCWLAESDNEEHDEGSSSDDNSYTYEPKQEEYPASWKPCEKCGKMTPSKVCLKCHFSKKK